MFLGAKQPPQNKTFLWEKEQRLAFCSVISPQTQQQYEMNENDSSFWLGYDE